MCPQFMRGFVPHSMERTASGRILVRWSESGSTEVAGQDEFDTVLAAVGACDRPCLHGLPS